MTRCWNEEGHSQRHYSRLLSRRWGLSRAAHAVANFGCFWDNFCASPLAVGSCCITITPTVVSPVNRALFLSRTQSFKSSAFILDAFFFSFSSGSSYCSFFFLRRRRRMRRRSPSCDRHSWPGGDSVHYRNVKLSIWERHIWFRSVEALLATCNCTCILNLVGDKSKRKNKLATAKESQLQPRGPRAWTDLL